MRHPDLMRLGRRLRERMDETLDAEQAAALAAARRRRSFRDLLLSAEDRGDEVLITTVDGRALAGSIGGVGADHIELVTGMGRHFLSLLHVVGVEPR